MSSIRDKANLNSRNKKLQFCPYCGAKLIGNAQFCTVCGEKITVDTQDDTSSFDDYSSQDESRDEYSNKFTSQSQHTDNTERQSNKNKRTKTNERETVYEGKLHKCPNCGEVLDSYAMRCPACGYEIRDAGAVSSVKELADKLEKINAQKMDSDVVFSRKKRVQEFYQEQESEKASLITNFSIPNTKEDILDFIILASTNINPDDENGLVSKAWRTKLEQAYRKAKAVMKDQPEFDQVQDIYYETTNKVRFKKSLGWIFLIVWFNTLIFIPAILSGAIGLTVISILVYIGLIVWVVALHRKPKH